MKIAPTPLDPAKQQQDPLNAESRDTIWLVQATQRYGSVKLTVRHSYDGADRWFNSEAPESTQSQ